MVPLATLSQCCIPQTPDQRVRPCCAPLSCFRFQPLLRAPACRQPLLLLSAPAPALHPCPCCQPLLPQRRNPCPSPCCRLAPAGSTARRGGRTTARRGPQRSR